MKKIFLWLLLLFVLAAGISAYQNREGLERKVLEKTLNDSLKDIFAGTIRLDQVRIDSALKLHIQGISGSMKTATQPVGIRIRSLESEDPISDLLFSRPVRFRFEHLSLADSAEKGMTGDLTYTPGKIPKIENTGTIEGLDLHDLEWADPQNLKGASGLIEGNYHLSAVGENIETFRVHINAPEGGMLQAKFFELIKQYLPELQANSQLETLSRRKGLIPYQKADLQVNLESADRLKVLLKILVKDYNLQLNLNLEIRLDEKNAFAQAARVLGLIKIT